MSTFEEKLINLVREHDYLYNTKSRSYKNIIKRDSTWAKIAEELARPIDECKKRWKSLRDRFVREKKKMDQPSGSGATESEEWEFYNSLEFLTEAMRPRKQVGNYDTVNESLFEVLAPNNENSSTYMNCSTPEPTQRQSAKRSRRGDLPFTEFFGDLSNTLAQRFSTKEEDENDIFMKMIAAKMKVLPQDAKIRLQEKFLRETNNEILLNSNNEMHITD